MIRALVVAVLVMFATYAFAHGWYPRECCAGTDCAPLHPDRVRIDSTGYTIDGRHHVPYHIVRDSPDQQYHGCFPAPSRSLKCFFAPRPAS